MTRWRLEDFLERFDEWVERDHPPDDWRVDSMYWIHGLQEDPFRGAARRTEFGVDWWFAEIPGAGDEHKAVVCFYSVTVGDAMRPGVVRCAVISTLTRPII